MLYALFLLSGATGLLYEVVWIRQAGTVIGNTTYAIGTVVGVFMGGLALGAWAGGRAADRRSGAPLLALYGKLEIAVALTALAVGPLFALSEPLFGVLWHALGESSPVYVALRVLLVGIVLLAPTTLMGATLPILTRYIATSDDGAARAAGRMYAVNTFGGVLGVLAAGFWLVPGLGLTATLLTAAVVNVLIGLASIALARGRGGALAPELPTADRPPRLPLIVAAGSGFAALVCEVAWTRSLILTIGSTVYAFTLILAAFILGLALGSAATTALLPRLRAPRALAVVQAAIGMLALGLLPFLGDLPLRFAPMVDGLREDPGRLLWAQFGLAALFVLVPATLMGAVFPLAVRMASTTAVGRSVGAVYTWNTLGSISGSLAASFALIPALGLSGSVKLAAVVNLALAGLLVRPPLAAVGAVAGLALAFVVPSWNAKVLASGAFLYGAADLRSAKGQSLGLRDYLEKDTELLGTYWDAYGLVTVHRQRDGLLTMRVNGKADASTGPSDRPNMDFTGHLPLMHHPAPKRALLIGLGGGLTLEAMRRHPLERIDCVDISRAVVAGAKHFPEAGRSLADPRVRMIVGDGRSLVSFAREPYDVVVSQPSNLWVSGMANLFTRDFFEEVRGALAPGGVFGQWVHAYWLSPDDFRSVLRTFFAVFPEGSLWEVFPGSDYVLVAGGTGLHRTELLSEHVAGALTDYRIGDAAAKRFAGEGPVVTDDRCTLEYTAPKALYRDLRAELLSGLDAIRPDNARRGLAKAVAAFAERRPTHAIRELPSDLDPRARLFADDVTAAVIEIGARRRDRGDVAGSAAAFSLVTRGTPRYAEAQVELGDLRAQTGDFDEAGAAFLRAREADPRSFGAAVGLALIHRARGENGRAVGYLEEAVALRPDSAPAWLELAETRVALGRLDAAQDAARRALTLDPANARAAALTR